MAPDPIPRPAPGEAARQPVIAALNVTKHFQAITALHDVSIPFHAGEVHVLFGENGAGKSTLINLLAGIHRPDEGALELEGRKVNLQSPREALELGITAVFQEPALVPTLTVAENLSLGREHTRAGLLKRGRTGMDATAALDRIGAGVRTDRLARDLTRAERQIVEIARALQGSAKVLILDEPTASLTDEETDHLFAIVDRLREQGLAIIYITHRMQEIRRIGDVVSVLRDGRLISTQQLESVSNDDLVRLMTGREVGAIFPEITRTPGEVALELIGVDGPTVRDITIEVRRGEIVGLAGLVGSGKGEVGQLIFGMVKPEGGQIRIDGASHERHAPSARLSAGLVFYPADRKRNGLIDIRPVRENATLGALRRWGRGPFINRQSERAAARAIFERLNLRPLTPESIPAIFSGGNQQKVVLARGFTRDYEVHVFDEPTAGVDVGARSEIYQAMKQLVERGAALLLISSDLPEIVGLAHRAYVMAEGRVVGEFTGADLTESTMLPAFFVHPEESRTP